MKRIIFFLFLNIIISFTLYACEKNNKVDTIAVVGDKIITKDQFIARAEFSVRPNFMKDKEITLHNLILEKWLALEEESIDTLKNNIVINSFLTGIKEQKMRQVLFNQVAKRKVNIDEKELSEYSKQTGITYIVQFYNFPSIEQSKKFQDLLQSNIKDQANVFVRYAKGNKISERKISFNDPENDLIHKALFMVRLNQNDVVGPISIDKDNILFMKIVEVSNFPALSPEENMLKYNEAKNRLTSIKANELWEEYVKSVMSNKRLDFTESVFYEMAQRFLSNLDSQSDYVSDVNIDYEEVANIPSYLMDGTINMERPFFTFDGEIWSIERFKNTLQRHPLVFRKSEIPKKQFTEHFKYAIADMLRDEVLNEEAYKSELDKDTLVEETYKLWKDAVYANIHLENFISNLPKRKDFNEKKMKGEYNFLDDYITQLEVKYQDMTSVNYSMLENTSITKSDMIAVQSNVPFQRAVPGFPMLTTRKINEL